MWVGETKIPSYCHLTHVLKMTFQKWETDRGKRKRTIRGRTCVCAFKSPQARAECWESRPVPFSWPLRGGRFASGSMDGDVTSEKIQEGTTNISAHPNMRIIAGNYTLRFPVCLGLHVLRCTRQQNNHIFYPWLQIPFTVMAQFILCWDRNMNVYVSLKIVVTHWMWGRNCHLSNL